MSCCFARWLLWAGDALSRPSARKLGPPSESRVPHHHRANRSCEEQRHEAPVGRVASKEALSTRTAPRRRSRLPPACSAGAEMGQTSPADLIGRHLARLTSRPDSANRVAQLLTICDLVRFGDVVRKRSDEIDTRDCQRSDPTSQNDSGYPRPGWSHSTAPARACACPSCAGAVEHSTLSAELPAHSTSWPAVPPCRR